MSEKLLRFSSNDLNLVEIFFNSQRYLNWQSLRIELSFRYVNMSINPSFAVSIDLLLLHHITCFGLVRLLSFGPQITALAWEYWLLKLSQFSGSMMDMDTFLTTVVEFVDDENK